MRLSPIHSSKSSCAAMGKGGEQGASEQVGYRIRGGQEEEESKVTRPSGTVAVGAARSYKRQTPARETPDTFERGADTWTDVP